MNPASAHHAAPSEKSEGAVSVTGPKKRGPRKRFPKETHCAWCGEKLGPNKSRFCSNEHAQFHQNSLRNKGVRENFHFLVGIDEDARTATCSLCGPNTKILSGGTRLKVDGSRMWKCRNKERRWEVSKREAAWRRRGINLTVPEYEKYIELQEGACAICRDPFDTTPHVDHCHDNGHVRGLLCTGCNTGLGQFKHDPTRLGAAAGYLLRDAQRYLFTP